MIVGKNVQLQMQLTLLTLCLYCTTLCVVLCLYCIAEQLCAGGAGGYLNTPVLIKCLRENSAVMWL